MIRKNFYLTEKQSKQLEEMNGLTISEHIRRAIDEYIIKYTLQYSVTSPSKPSSDK